MLFLSCTLGTVYKSVEQVTELQYTHITIEKFLRKDGDSNDKPTVMQSSGALRDPVLIDMEKSVKGFAEWAHCKNLPGITTTQRWNSLYNWCMSGAMVRPF